MNLQNFLKQSLEEVKEKKLYRTFKENSLKPGAYSVINGEKVLQFSSNNYLGLAGDEKLIKASIDAAKQYGIGSTGSRLITGTHKMHLELEEKIAKFKNTEKAIVFSTGYSANLGLFSSILSEKDAVYSDELNHASIIDGIKLSKTNKFIYKHCDINDLEEKLKQNHKKFRLNIIVTDSIFSMDGDRAPLQDIVKLKEKYNAVLVLDEAHAFGIYGPNGEGLAHEYNLNEKIDIQMGTLSKAAGSEGGYIAGSTELINFLANHSRSFIFSTAPAIPSIAASLAAINAIEQNFALRNKLLNNISYLKSCLNNSSLDIIPSESAIFCINTDNVEQALKISKKLLEEYKIMASAIRPPTVKTPRIRVCTMALHSKDNIEYLTESLLKASK